MCKNDSLADCSPDVLPGSAGLSITVVILGSGQFVTMGRLYSQKNALYCLGKTNRLKNLDLDRAAVAANTMEAIPERPCSRKPAGDRKSQGLEKLALNGVCDRFQAVMGVEFLIDMVQMVAKGLRRNLQVPGDRCGVLAQRK
jgi:hypothetical protein